MVFLNSFTEVIFCCCCYEKQNSKWQSLLPQQIRKNSEISGKFRHCWVLVLVGQNKLTHTGTKANFFFFFLILHKPKVFPRNYDVSSDEAGLARCPCSRRLVFLIVKCLSGAANPQGLYRPSVPVACCTDPSCQVPQSLHSPAWAPQAMATMVPVKLQSFFILLALCSRTLRAMNGSQQHCL